MLRARITVKQAIMVQFLVVTKQVVLVKLLDSIEH